MGVREARYAVEEKYAGEFAEAHQPEADAFDLAIHALVRHGRPTELTSSVHDLIITDPLSTGFLLLNTPYEEKDKTVASAIRVGLTGTKGNDPEKIPYAEILRAQEGEADSGEVARLLGEVVSCVEVRACVLATRRADVAPSQWRGLVREFPLTMPLSNQPDEPQDTSLSPEVAMWSAPLPALASARNVTGKVYLNRETPRRVTPTASSVSVERYAQAVRGELTAQRGRKRLCQMVDVLLTAAATINTPVSTLGEPAVTPLPPEDK